jgi:hypothetical protein
MKNLFDIVVAVAFQSVFRLEIHQNIFFISIQQNNLKKKLKIKKYINNFYFLKKILETQNQSISKAFVNGFMAIWIPHLTKLLAELEGT